MTTKAHYRNRPETLRMAEDAATPVYVLRKNTGPQIEQCLVSIAESMGVQRPAHAALQEVKEAAERLLTGEDEDVALRPQTSYIRRLQHEFAQSQNLDSRSSGREPLRRVRLYRTSGS